MKTKLVLLLIAITSISFAQNGGKSVDATFKEFTNTPSISYFEVSKEMFKMLSETPEASADYKNYIKQLHGLKMIQLESKASGNKLDIYNAFHSKANLKNYSLLMTKKNPNSQMTFYKLENKSENEFLLISNKMVVYIKGTINLKSIGEFEQIMEVAGSAFNM